MNQIVKFIAISIGYFIFSIILMVDVIVLLYYLASLSQPKDSPNIDNTKGKISMNQLYASVNNQEIVDIILTFTSLIAFGLSPFLFMKYVPKDGYLQYCPIFGVLGMILVPISLKHDSRYLP
jgi:hypothetical protein